jgi:hypothetical protein
MNYPIFITLISNSRDRMVPHPVYQSEVASCILLGKNMYFFQLYTNADLQSVIQTDQSDLKVQSGVPAHKLTGLTSLRTVNLRFDKKFCVVCRFLYSMNVS